MADDPLDMLLIRSLAFREILRQLVLKTAKSVQPEDSMGWIADLAEEVEITRAIALAAAPANPDHQKLAADVDDEVKRFFNQFEI